MIKLIMKLCMTIHECASKFWIWSHSKFEFWYKKNNHKRTNFIIKNGCKSASFLIIKLVLLWLSYLE